MVGIRDVQNYSPDNFTLQARLLQPQTQCHGSYLQGRQEFNLSLPMPEDFRPSDKKFQDMKALESTPPPWNPPPTPPMDVGDINLPD